jgi:hypothetical protein
VKLPVFKTLGQTFGFVVERRFFTLLRLTWFPALLSAIFSLMPNLYADQVLGIHQDRYEVGVHYGVGFTDQDAAKIQEFANSDHGFQAISVISAIAQLLLSAVIAIAIHRLILLDDRRPGVFFNLRLGREEWQYVLAWILYGVVAFLAFAPVFAHLANVGYEQQWNPATWKSGTAVDQERVRQILEDPRLQIALGVGFLFMLVAITRFGLIFPGIVAEGHISFANSWRLTRGNFWRLIGFWILLAILGVCLMFVMAIIFGIAVGLAVASVAAGGQTVGAVGLLVFSVPAVVTGLVLLVLAIALFVAGLSFTYKALGGEARERLESTFGDEAHAT